MQCLSSSYNPNHGYTLENCKWAQIFVALTIRHRKRGAFAIFVHFYSANLGVFYTRNPGYTLRNIKWAERVVARTIRWREKWCFSNMCPILLCDHWALTHRKFWVCTQKLWVCTRKFWVALENSEYALENSEYALKNCEYALEHLSTFIVRSLGSCLHNSRLLKRFSEYHCQKIEEYSRWLPAPPPIMIPDLFSMRTKTYPTYNLRAALVAPRSHSPS